MRIASVERYGPAFGDGSVIVGYGAVWISVVDACGVKKLGSGLQPLICSADAAGPKILERPE